VFFIESALILCIVHSEVLTNPAAAGHTSFSLQASFSCPTTGLVLSVTDEETKQLLSQSAALGAVIVANALMKKGKVYTPLQSGSELGEYLCVE
jgi:hypothetical protein